MNKVILLGNLGQDPEVRYTQSGSAVANFRIATSERFKKGDDWEERTEWHRIVVFGRQAENCGQYLSKGRQVCVEGRLQTRQWEDRDGNTRYTTEIVARDVVFLGGGGGGGGRGGRGGGGGGGGYGGPSGGGGGQGPGGGYDEPPPPGADESDVPF